MEGKGRRQERASYSFFPSSARDGGGPSRSWFAFFCVLVWFLMASVLFPLSAWPVLGNSGWEYQLRGGSCIVPITAVCGHIPTIKTQKEKKEEKKKTHHEITLFTWSQRGLGVCCLAKCLMKSLKEFCFTRCSSWLVSLVSAWSPGSLG